MKQFKGPTKSVLDDTEVIIPWFGNDTARGNNVCTVAYWWGRAGVTVRLADCPSDSFRKGLAVTLAAERSRASWLIVADGDVWADGWTEALVRVAEGTPWAMPHATVRRLAEEPTRELWATSGFPRDDMPLVEPEYVGTQAGGIVVISRKLYLDVPLDCRFAGWGCEDTSWGYALEVMTKAPFKVNSPLYHLYHEPAPRADRKHGFPENEALRHRYQMATINETEMAKLIQEGKDEWQSLKSSLIPQESVSF